MKECALYEKIKPISSERVRCTACAHRCLITKGKTGICAIRKNIDGKLYLMVYGKVVSKNIDPIEKKPLFHFLPHSYSYSIGTFGCNFRCGFCQNYDISQFKETESYLEGIFGEIAEPSKIVEEAIRTKCRSISYTYNEPTIFIEFVKDIAELAKKKGLKNVLVTNGYMTHECLEFIAPYVDAMNIDLKSFTNEFYLKNCGAKLEPVLESIKLAHEKGIHIEITTLLIPGENDSETELENMAKFIASVDKNIPWHISRFFPMYKMLDKETTPYERMKIAEKIGKKYLKYVYLGNI
ncbi:MAG TPA: AmmeMemoRadiSam system radical SAM enzyme [Candidatus Nanoarchaeia archaeon]|nr:AmmeMemoRadiSam system radical SAM enzyme [Candidatus Nanoarchaeia archaeon]